MAKRGKQQTGTLAKLEREIHELNARRHKIIAEIMSVVDQLSLGAMTQIAEIGQLTGLGAELPGRTPPAAPAKRKVKKTRNVSPEVRERLSKLVKARWAKAKKAGKTKLG